MKKYILAFATLLTGLSFAQPEITNGSNVAGLTFSFPLATTSTVNVGSAGANQTWDFSSLTFNDVGTFSIVDKSTTPFAGDFPSANWCWMVYPAYSYFEITSTEMLNWAFLISTTGGNNDYSVNPKKLLSFPFNYQNSLMDYYEEQGSVSDVTVTYDAYGTLVMPGGYTYYNVVRVNESYQGTDDYKWYTLNPLMSVAVFDGDANTLYWVKSDLTGGLSNGDLKDLSVYPNPSTGEINLTFSTLNNEENVDIYNLTGQLVKSIQLSCSNSTTSYTINTKDLIAGSYLLKIGGSTRLIEIL